MLEALVERTGVMIVSRRVLLIGTLVERTGAECAMLRLRRRMIVLLWALGVAAKALVTGLQILYSELLPRQSVIKVLRQGAAYPPGGGPGAGCPGGIA